MMWNTALSSITDAGEIIRGEALTDLIAKKSFVETIILLWSGKMPTAKETVMFNALFTACIDHGVGAPSATVARTAVSAGNNVHTAVAAGILTTGELHGGAIEGAAVFFQANSKEKNVIALAQRLKEQKIRVPGYGHKVLAVDERSKALFSVAKKQGFYKEHCVFAEKFGAELTKLSSKPLPLNIDGAMAAIISDMGYDARLAKGFFLVGRLPGLVAHVYEQMLSGEGLKRIDEKDINYIGPQ